MEIVNVDVEPELVTSRLFDIQIIC